MTDAQIPDTANPPHAARFWLAIFLALLVAILPGPQVTAAASQTTQLNLSTNDLTAIHGRDLIARKDAVQIRPLAATALPPPSFARPPPRAGASVAYAYRSATGAGACPLAPHARAPPILRTTA